MDGFLERAVVEELRKHHVERLIAVSALNNPRRLHAEQMIQRVRKRLHIPDDARIYGASERQQCAARCALLYPPDMPTGFGRAYGLTVWETARMEQLVARARKDAAVSGPKAQDRAERHVRSQLEELERTRNASTREKLQLDLEEARKVSKSWERQVLSHSLFASAEPACPRPSALGQHLSVPGGDAKSPALVLAAADVECDEDKATSGDADSTASADASGTDDAIGATGLGATLTNPGLGNGGIDFSTMKLSYLADPGDGSGLQYSFNANLNPLRGDVRQSTGVAAATQSSDAFFVWLALNPQHFWVNLSPDEPDRIVDGQLGRTDAGRVLLEADLQMKKTVAKLTHPHTTLGKRYWDGIRGDCVSSRNWIVPAPASVYQDGDKLYILDAPLDVKMETRYVVASGDSADTPTCPKQDQATEDHNEHLDRTLILPRLRKAINTAPEYAALRRVHLARVAAEWYRELSTTKDTTYGELWTRATSPTGESPATGSHGTPLTSTSSHTQRASTRLRIGPPGAARPTSEGTCTAESTSPAFPSARSPTARSRRTSGRYPRVWTAPSAPLRSPDPTTRSGLVLPLPVRRPLASNRRRNPCPQAPGRSVCYPY
ncbi:hypothetical protein J3S85_25475 [Streptomyces lavenduligriseus]|nr:hypothetical protein J3S85_25475 [Streptomyces lavenduligriseus]